MSYIYHRRFAGEFDGTYLSVLFFDYVMWPRAPRFRVCRASGKRLEQFRTCRRGTSSNARANTLMGHAENGHSAQSRPPDIFRIEKLGTLAKSQRPRVALYRRIDRVCGCGRYGRPQSGGSFGQ